MIIFVPDHIRMARTPGGFVEVTRASIPITLRERRVSGYQAGRPATNTDAGTRWAGRIYSMQDTAVNRDILEMAFGVHVGEMELAETEATFGYDERIRCLAPFDVEGE